MTESPVISVVIPLPDDRGHVLECLDGFIQQNLSVAHEVIVPTQATSGDEISWLVQQFPQVHWLHVGELKIAALYNAGAEAARGEYLYISESHCVPRRDCLQQIYDYVRLSRLPAACSASDGINPNYVAAGEQRIFEEDFHRWMNAGKCKIAIRGTLIERELWQQVGGFQAEFGHFAEMLIGRKLEAIGTRFGFALNSIVSHGNQVSLKALSDELIEYGKDECRSCDLLPAEMQIAETREWTERAWLLENMAWLQMRQRKEAVRQMFRQLAINYLPMSGEWRFRVFRRFWQSAIRQGRLRYVASMKNDREETKALTESPAVSQKAA